MSKREWGAWEEKSTEEKRREKRWSRKEKKSKGEQDRIGEEKREECSGENKIR